MSISITSQSQKSRIQVLTSESTEAIQGRLIWNLQSARSTQTIALLNNQSN